MRKTLKEITDLASVAAYEAKRQYRRDSGVSGLVISRGRYLTVLMADEHSNTKNPIEGETWRWDGTVEDIYRAIRASATDGYRPVEVTIFGGFNHAESLRAYQNGEYDPLVTEWEVKIPVAELPKPRLPSFGK